MNRTKKKVVSGMRKEAREIDTEGIYTTENKKTIHGYIREVVSATGLNEGAFHDNELERVYEESLKGFREGAIIKGTVVDKGEGFILVDIGYKSEGHIPAAEFQDSHGTMSVEIGDSIEVLLVRREDEEGRPVLSRKAVGTIKRWNQIKEAYEEGWAVRGKIISRVRGGFSVDIGIKAFLPRSQFDRRHMADEGALLGTEHEFKILQHDKRTENVVVSRRAIVEEQRTALRRETLEHVEEGAILQGEIINITPYGLFVDVGGVDGLVHISDITWSKRGQPLTPYSIGDEISVTVLSIDREMERVSLGIEQLEPNPWDEIEERYKPGDEVKGMITAAADFGVFVQLEKGIEGLIHVSEIPKKKGEDPLRQLHVGNEIKATVTRASHEEQKIGLSLRKRRASFKKAKPKTKAKDDEKVASNVGEALKEAMRSP